MTSEHIGFAYHTLLMIVMIGLRARFPYLARLCRCFLLADIWFLGNPAWCEEQSQMEMRFILVWCPREAGKSPTSSCYLFVLLVFGEIAITMWLGQ